MLRLMRSSPSGRCSTKTSPCASPARWLQLHLPDCQPAATNPSPARAIWCSLEAAMRSSRLFLPSGECVHAFAVKRGQTTLHAAHAEDHHCHKNQRQRRPIPKMPWPLPPPAPVYKLHNCHSGGPCCHAKPYIKSRRPSLFAASL